MPKNRFTPIDVKAVVDELKQTITGLRLVNLYDLSPRMYLFKFGQGDKKVYVLFESGMRLHITTYSREKPKLPSQFTLKLRKHVRSWRLDSISQLGCDRVVDMHFGSGDTSYHLILELFGQGNFVLTDQNFTVLMLLRSQKSEDVRWCIKEPYPVKHVREFQPRTREQIIESLQKAGDTESLKTVLPLSAAYGAVLAEHLICACGAKPGDKRRSWPADLEKFADRIAEVCTAIDLCFTQPLQGGGILIRATPIPPSNAQPADANAVSCGQTDDPSSTVQYDEFWPASLRPYLDESKVVAVHRTATFSESVDRCCLSSEQSHIEQHNQRKETVVLSKKEKFLKEHQRRIDSLQSEQDKNRNIAEVIQLNIEEVDAAIQLVNDVLAAGISWDHLSTAIRQRQAEGSHPVANIIHELKLHKSTISLLLSQECGEDDDAEDGDLQPLVVDVDITMNAFQNAGKYHSTKKQVSRKLEKTIEVTASAAEAAGKKGERLAKKQGADKKDIQSLRPPFWFEKFCWFVSSCGHLVISGHDSQQSDLIVKKYMSPSDIFVHGDLPSCQPCIVKNPAAAPVGLPSVEEAGVLCLGRSEAWKKAPISPWWVQGSQVSKRGPSGEFYAVGAFYIRGQKNYVQAMQLQLTSALIFQVSTQQTYPTPENDATLSYISLIGDEPTTPATTAGGSLWGDSDVDNQGVIGARLPSTDFESGDEVRSPTSAAMPGFPSVPSPTFGATANRSKQQLLRRNQTSSPNNLSKNTTPTPTPGQAALTPTQAETNASSETEESGTVSVRSTQTPASQGVKAYAAAEPDDACRSNPKSKQGPPPPNASRTMRKLRKIRKKYEEQDEEERALAMALHGNPIANVHQKYLQEKTKPDEPASDDGEGNESDGGAQLPAAEEKQRRKQVAFSSKNEEDAIDDMEQAHEQMRQRQVSYEEESAKLTEKILAELQTVVPFLTGSLSQQDQPLCAMAVVAPLSAARNYSFKLKITPGTEKKGQSAKTIWSSFVSMANVACSTEVPTSVLHASVAQATQRVTLEEIVMQLPATVKVHAPDASSSATLAGAEDKNGDAKSQRQAQKERREAAEAAKLALLREDHRARRRAKEAAVAEASPKKHADPTISMA